MVGQRSVATVTPVDGRCRLRFEWASTATVKSIDPDAFMDQAASSYVIAVRV